MTMKTSLSFRINAIAATILFLLVTLFSGEEKSPETIFDSGDYCVPSFAEEHADLMADAAYDQAYAMEDALYAEPNDNRLAERK